MTVEKVNELPSIYLASQKSPNITIKADKNQLRTNIRSSKPERVFYLTYPMKLKKLIFRDKCLFPGSNRSNRGVGNTAVGRDIWYASVDCFA